MDGKPRLLGQTHLNRGWIVVRYIGFYRHRHRRDGERVAFFERDWPWWKTLCGFPP
jgi:hypothetical protein